MCYVNSKKPVKFAHLEKIAHQSTLKAHVTETTKECIVAFMKARILKGKEQKIVKMYFLKAFVKIF